MHPSLNYDLALQRHVEKLHLAEQVRMARATETQLNRRDPWAALRSVLRTRATSAVKPSPRPAS